MSNMPPVVHLTDNLKAGGLQRIVVQLANEAAKRRLDISVMSERRGELLGQLNSGVRHISISNPKYLHTLPELVSKIRQLAKDDQAVIVHAHQRRVALAANIASTRSPILVVEHVHNTFNSESRLARLSSFRSPQIIACGSSIERMLTDDFHKSPAKVTVIQNAIYDDPTANKIRIPCSHSNALGFKLVGVGRLSEQKDPFKFFSIARKLIDSGFSVYPRWVGDGPLRESVASHIASLGFSPDSMIGHSTHVRLEIADADALLLTSRWEGLPLVILETMSVGRGAIVPNIGSCADIVKNNVNGLVYDSALDESEIAHLIGQNLSESNLTRWSRAARTTFIECGSVEQMFDDVSEVYGRLVGERACG